MTAAREKRCLTDGYCCVCQGDIGKGEPIRYLLSRTSHRPAITHPGKCYTQALDNGGIPDA